MSETQTADHALIRKLNKAIILDVLRRLAPLSRAEVAAHTGLNRSTVSIIINSLIEEGFVQETDLQSARVGRPGMQLVLNPQGGFAVGMEIGVDYVSVLLTDFTAQEIWREHILSDPEDDQSRILERAASLTQQALDRGHALGLRPLGIGVGVPGLVDTVQGRLVFAPNLQWENVPLRTMWVQRFDLPTFVENEANAAALGEYYFGSARGMKDYIYLSAGIGLGSGIMIDGRLFRGSSGYASEVGHMTIAPDGDLCGCGRRGCWETLVGPRAVLRKVRATLAVESSSILPALVNGNLESIRFEDVLAAAQADDKVAIRALQDVGRYLGIGVVNLVNIFNPELIVLGGALNLASSFLLPEIVQQVRTSALRPNCENFRVVPSAFGMDAALIGAIALVVDDILRDPKAAGG